MIDSLTLSLFSWLLNEESLSSLKCTSREVNITLIDLCGKNSFWCQRVQALLGRSTMPTLKESDWKSVYGVLSLCSLEVELGLHQDVFVHLSAMMLLSERWEFSESVLTMACIVGTPEVVSFLLSVMKGVSDQVLISASGCWSVIQSLSVCKTIPLLLLDARIDPRAHDNLSFIAACRTGNLEVVKLLHADPRVDVRGRASLGFRCACLHGHTDVVRFLLESKKVTTADLTILELPTLRNGATPEMLQLLGL